MFISAGRISGFTTGGVLYLNVCHFIGTITGSAISGGTITGGKISGGTISGSSISGGTISGSSISGGTISGGAISGGSISGAVLTTCSLGTSYLKVNGTNFFNSSATINYVYAVYPKATRAAVSYVSGVYSNGTGTRFSVNTDSQGQYVMIDIDYGTSYIDLIESCDVYYKQATMNYLGTDGRISDARAPS